MAQIIKTDCGLCVNCCGLDVHVEDDRIIKIEGTKEHWLNAGSMCPKGEHLMDWVYSPNRLKYPMKKVNGRFQRISWDQAMDEIAARLNVLKEKYGSHTLMLWTGSVGVEHIEMSYFMQRFRGAFGSPHFYNAEGICFRTRILARQMTFGRCPAEEPRNSNLVILWGNNPDASYFMNGKMIRERVAQGMKLVVIDPRRIPLADHGIYLQPRPGTDCAIALAMMNVIITEELWDKEFVDKWTSGFDKLTEHVKAYTPEQVEIISGVPAADIKNVARLYATTDGSCILEGVCSTNQQINGLQTHRANAILQSITGNVDVPGGWVTTPMLPLTDMRLPVEEKPLGAEEFPVFYQFGKRPAPYGSSSLLTEAIIKEKPYPIKAFINAGGNPAVTFPDTKRFMEAMKNIELNVCIDPFMTETGELADYVLPACTFLEETGVGGFPYCLSHCTPYVMLRKKCIEPLHESKAVWWIYNELGRKLGYEEYFPWKTDEEVVEYLFSKSVIPYQKLVDNPEGRLL
ncbi:molybdopterin oxidoreductase, partial [delta proteobacterium NaphS2]